MRLFWWQQFTLLILIQLLEPSRTSHKFQADALFTSKSTIGGSQQSDSLIGSYPCLRQRASTNCYKLKDQGVSSPLPRICTLSLQAKTLGLSSPFTSRVLHSHSSIHLQEEIQSSRNKWTAVARDNGDAGVPTLTATQEAHEHKHKTRKVAAIIGGAVAAFLVVMVAVIVYFCLMRVKRFVRRSSESASSVPSLSAEWERGNISPYAVPLSPFETQNLRELRISELEEATCNFSQNNIIGEGRFGLAYKGLLQDGSIVAIKRRLHAPTRSFFQQVRHLARVQNAHLVRLVGYYYDSDQQLLVYDYLSNGNVGNHLYDSEGLPIGKLSIRQRLSIAVGAARGLGHLHSLVPPVLHMHFRTRNVLLDENFTAKVSDYGLTSLLIEGNHAGSSSSIDCFLDPELDMQKNASEGSDVYSFGVFLLELISGRDANAVNQSNSAANLVQQAKQSEEFEEFVDKSLGKQARHSAKQVMELAFMCIDSGPRGPPMEFFMEALERIHEGEIARLSSELDVQISAVTLGSELFK